MNVYLNDFRQQWMAIKSDAIEVFDLFASSGWYVFGDKVRSFAENEVSLPIHPLLSAAGVDAIIDASNPWQP